MVLGLNSCGSSFPCHRCFWQKGGPEKDKYTECILDLIEELIKSKFGGHIQEPILQKLPLSQYKTCLLHMKMAFGKMLVKFIHSWVESSTDIEKMWDIVISWQARIGLHFDIHKPNQHETWNVSGSDASRIMEPCNWDALCRLLKIPEQKQQAVRDIDLAFTHLFTPTEQGTKWLHRNIISVSRRFKVEIAPFSKSFYMHYTICHLLDDISISNDLWLHCQDTQETVQYIGSTTYTTTCNLYNSSVLQNWGTSPWVVKGQSVSYV